MNFRERFERAERGRLLCAKTGRLCQVHRGMGKKDETIV